MRRGVAKFPPNHVRFITCRCDSGCKFQSLQIDMAHGSDDCLPDLRRAWREGRLRGQQYAFGDATRDGSIAPIPPNGSQREETPMRRRDLLKAGIGAAAALAAPRVGGAAAAKTLVVAPTADLVVLDPVVTFNRQTRNYPIWCLTRCTASIRAGRRSRRWSRGMRSTMTG